MMFDGVRDAEERALYATILEEFLDMPGLVLTIPQACRLWAVDRERCTRVLDRLRAEGFLRRSGDTYLRADAAGFAA